VIFSSLGKHAKTPVSLVAALDEPAKEKNTPLKHLGQELI